MAHGSNTIDVTAYLVGIDEDDAQQNQFFDSEASAYSYSEDNKGTQVFTVTVTIDFDTMEPAES